MHATTITTVADLEMGTVSFITPNLHSTVGPKRRLCSPDGFPMYMDTELIRKTQVGNGATAEVWICKIAGAHEGGVDPEYCIAKIAIPHADNEGGERRTIDEIMRECTALSYFNEVDPGVAVRCLGTLHVLEKIPGDPMAQPRISLPKGIVLEYFPHADFFSVLRILQNPDGQPVRPLHPAVARWYITDVLLRLSAIHRAEFYHGDVKPENLLMTPEGRVVFADFGDASTDDETQWDMMGFGTPGCQAPEVCDNRENGTPTIVGPRRPSDMWSVGVMLCYMLFADQPFNEEDEGLAYTQICEFFVRGEWPEIVNDPYAEERDEGLAFLQQLLTFNPENRIKCSEIEHHEWLRDHWEDTACNRREAPLVIREGKWCVGKTWEGLVTLPNGKSARAGPVPSSCFSR